MSADDRNPYSALDQIHVRNTWMQVSMLLLVRLAYCVFAFIGFAFLFAEVAIQMMHRQMSVVEWNWARFFGMVSVALLYGALACGLAMICIWLSRHVVNYIERIDQES